MSLGKLTSGTRLARNASLGFITEIGIFLILLVVMPQVVHRLGTVLFGLFALAWVVLNYLSVFDVGISSATTKFLAEHFVRAEAEQGATLVRTSASINFMLGAGTGLLLAAMAPLLVRHIFKIPAPLQQDAVRMFWCVACAIPVLLVQGVCRSVVITMQRFGWNSFLRIAAQALQWSLILLAVYRGWHIYGVVAMAVAARIASVLGYALVIFRIFPAVFAHMQIELGLWRKLISFGGWVSVSQVSAPLLVYLDRVVLAAFAGLAAVSLYTVPFEAVSRVGILPASMVATLFPAFSERMAHSGAASVSRLYSEAVRYLALLLLPCFGFLAIFGPELLRLWMGVQFAADAGLIMRLIAIGVLFNAMAYVPMAAVRALGRPDVVAKIQLIEAGVYVVLCVLLVKEFGALGAASALVLRFAADSCLLYWAADRFVGCRLGAIFERGIGSVVAAALGLDLGFVAIHYLGGSPIRQFAIAALLLVAALPIFWKVIMDERDKAVALRLVGVAPDFVSARTQPAVAAAETSEKIASGDFA